MKLKVKKLTPTAKIPELKTIGESNQVEIGIDLVADRVEIIGNGKYRCYSGIAVEPPEGYFMALYPRSSVHKHDSVLVNSVGIIDPTYRGDVSGIFEFGGFTHSEPYTVGDRFAQLVLHKNYTCQLEIEEVQELEETGRGDGGFGSTGR